MSDRAHTVAGSRREIHPNKLTGLGRRLPRFQSLPDPTEIISLGQS